MQDPDAPAVVTFLQSIRHEILERYRLGSPTRHRAMTVDLTPVRELDLGGALTLVAELDRWQRYVGKRLSPTTIANWEKDVRDKLIMLGFFALLKTRTPPTLRGAQSDIWIPFTSGVFTIGGAARRLRIKLEQHFGGSIGMRGEIYASLVEAMKNAFQHAYPDDFMSARFARLVGRRWWMTGMVSKQRRQVQLAFLDQGITIPGSLPNSWMWPNIEPAIRRAGDSDAARIVQAMQ